ncbi:MAG: hypothetical protein R2744_03450 [Bacteroidales bacterium]
MMPILFYAITADKSCVGLEKILDEKIVNPLNRIEGVGSLVLLVHPAGRYMLMLGSQETGSIQYFGRTDR